MKIKLKSDAIKEIALLMAPSSAGNPYYLNGEELVGFFNSIVDKVNQCFRSAMSIPS